MRPPYECEHGRLARQCAECELDAVKAERDRLAAALRYYANEDGWTYTTVYQQSGYSSTTAHRAIDDDDVDEHGAGKRARAALAQEADRG